MRVGRVLEPEVEGVCQGPPGARGAKGRAEEDPVGVLLRDQLAVDFFFFFFMFLVVDRKRKKESQSAMERKRGERGAKQ